MSVAQRRVEIAETLTDNLSDITVDPYKSASPAPFSGWLQIEQSDTEACTYGEVRLTIECQILVATDRTDFEKVQDVLTVPLINAVKAAGGRGVIVRPFTFSFDSTTFYAISAQFVTEATTESEVA